MKILVLSVTYALITRENQSSSFLICCIELKLIFVTLIIYVIDFSVLVLLFSVFSMILDIFLYIFTFLPKTPFTTLLCPLIKIQSPHQASTLID